MKRLLVLALVIAGLLVLNGCVAETSEQPGETEETVSASGVYEAIEPLLSAELEASYTVNIAGIVTHAFSDKFYLQDLDGSAAVKVELSEGWGLPPVNAKVVVEGNLRKYLDTYKDANLVVYKVEDATYEVLEENIEINPVEIDETFFATDNLYKRYVLVNATGTVYKYETGSYPRLYLEIPINDSTRSVIVFSYNNDVKAWINENAENLVGKELYVIGNWNWDYYRKGWQITVRTINDIPSASE